ncbi:LIRP isoform X1 [Schistocerca cancellata]|uniref:LIRP isoform X1 n=2 Tax=Schistocerca cancellata TaxID=274614 RepID=UPI0021194E97|nr:LIRP isoform X1 [Schistocerca cancellata]
MSSGRLAEQPVRGLVGQAALGTPASCDSSSPHHTSHPQPLQTPDMMWKLCLRLLAVLAVCLCTATQAQSDLFLLSPKRSGAPQPVARYCGEKLSNALKIVCRGNYNPMFKKASQDVSDAESEDNYWSGQSADEEVEAPALPPYPVLARPSAGGLLTAAVFRRRTRGVFDECCRKSCSISELQTYCGRR